ncbi:hypothetical protein EN962_16890 [Mesorhizobium sp. M7A.F.Ca.CA.001.09.2.1]|nr:hypothetical protein EN965_34315 [Mesorhizobium sp. M7A.F.Ca.CA.001.05.1.1]RUY63282.1 hypothetical protein EN980_28415 [Mesorhizobium sp. M7A.F.Ca.CA.001.13.1.1]RUY77234.1 hypothetical protein EN962_16890 [Mesorhizobium sp. M7A.F.Ca.CA.001.09.2.1]RUY88954.1 hypothetical protein EN974_30810 [Mesorhizobium sp. M7A.F.Ca.CA.001.12.2.1]RUZ09814.1 hypothetical protein EN955_02880 [Mesorhizobium sp. M7A.F.Ca.CA.001.04.2.1]RUZ16878.1 hypothetical protein EN961_25210 [Mesorhizobium sp. M7A.F.Ca.CA.0
MRSMDRPRRMTPKIGNDFRKGSCTKSRCYSVLCASETDARRCSDSRSLSPDGVCRFNARQNRAFA